MRALLVYPEYPDTFWSFKHALPFIFRKAAFAPLGLLTVAAMLPRQWDLRLADLNVRPLEDQDLAWADLVMVSAMLVQKPAARRAMARARAMGRRVVAGGPAFTARDADARDADHLVLNEAETTLPDFLADLQQGRPRRVYASNTRPDITATPAPRWDLIDFKDYVTMSVQFSRGCPFDCEFCSIVAMHGRRPRVKTPDQMMNELESLRLAGWRGDVFIVDDNFIGNKAQAKNLLAELGAWQQAHQHPFRFMTETSINLAQDETLMQLMRAANFHKVFVGIETPSEDSLRECGKMQNVQVDPREAVRTIHRHGMQVMGGFIVGFDSDDETIFERQIRFIQDLGVVTAMVGVLNAIPETRLWRRLMEEGRILCESTGNNTAGETNIIPRMGRQALLGGYKSLLDTIYDTKHYYRRINTFLKSYTPTAKGHIGLRDIAAFARSTWSIGVASRARFAYWRLLLKTLAFKRRALPVAVELAIMGRHFQRVARGVAQGLPGPGPAR